MHVHVHVHINCGWACLFNLPTISKIKYMSIIAELYAFDRLASNLKSTCQLSLNYVHLTGMKSSNIKIYEGFE